MSAGQPWGRTGRVVLAPVHGNDLTWLRVIADDRRVGSVMDERTKWLASPRWPNPWKRWPTRDEAVMYVLRRVAPKVWLVERPVMAKVERGYWHGERYWAVTLSGRGLVAWRFSWPMAVERAAECASGAAR